MHVHWTIVRNFPQAKLDSQINVRFLLNELGDLYFLLPNNSVHIMLFKLIGRKKVKTCKKTVTLGHANYNRKNNDHMNTLRSRRFK